MRYFKAWWEFYLLHLLYVISGIYIYTLLGPFTLFDPVLGAEIWGYPLMYPYPYPGLHYVCRPLRITQLDKITFCFWEPTKKADDKRMAKQMRSVFIFKYRVRRLPRYLYPPQITKLLAPKLVTREMADSVPLRASCIWLPSSSYLYWLTYLLLINLGPSHPSSCVPMLVRLLK